MCSGSSRLDAGELPIHVEPPPAAELQDAGSGQSRTALASVPEHVPASQYESPRRSNSSPKEARQDRQLRLVDDNPKQRRPRQGPRRSTAARGSSGDAGTPLPQRPTPMPLAAETGRSAEVPGQFAIQSTTASALAKTAWTRRAPASS